MLIQGDRGVGKSFLLNVFQSMIPKGTPYVYISEKCSDFKLKVNQAMSGWILIDGVEELTTEHQEIILEPALYQKLGKSLKICATSNLSRRELEQRAKLRPEILAHLSDTTFELLPLRERRHEIREFLTHFISLLGQYGVQNDVVEAFCSYDYSEGNIQELEDLTRQLKMFIRGETITARALPDKLITKADKINLTKRQNTFPISLDISIETLSFQLACSQLLLVLITKMVDLDRAYGRKTTFSDLASRLNLSRPGLTAKKDAMIEAGLISEVQFKKLIKG